MKLISAWPKALVAKVEGRKPLVMGDDEMRFPPLSRVIEPARPTELTDDQCRVILELYGISGVVAIQPGQTDEEALAAARELRMTWCFNQLRRYRQEQEERKAMGVAVSLPTQELRSWLREYRELRKQLGEDEVLTADIPGLSSARGVDPVKQEMDALGVSEGLTAQDALTDLQNAPF